MEIDVIRYNDEKEFTDGLFFIDGKFQVHTLEDEHRTKKVYGETRISDGRYKIEFRKEGGFHNRYLKKYGAEFHKGMLHVVNVPNFEYVLIHIGNDDDDTAGCLLVGTSNSSDKAGFIGGSRLAYEKIYPIIRDALLRGEEVFINYSDSVYGV
tara:strand:- start:2934 stop:3392 length:459 start_codon:yes stop_codon:yes gene_type:complete